MANKKYTSEILSDAAKQCTSIRQVLHLLGLKETGGNYSNIETRLKQFNVDISHFTGPNWRKGKTFPAKLEHKLVLNSTYTSGRPRSASKLRADLIKNRIKASVCECCGLTEWNGSPIPLELHHINGDPTDNRIENLQILCANCHAQTDNFCIKGRNSKLSSQAVMLDENPVKFGESLTANPEPSSKEKV